MSTPNEILENYIESTEHLYDCIGYSEGQACCLEKPETLKALHAATIEALAEIDLNSKTRWREIREAIDKLYGIDS